MISTVNQNGVSIYGVKEFVVDTPNDISLLDTTCKAGSTATVLSTSDVYKLNHNQQWILQSKGGGGEGTPGVGIVSVQVNENNHLIITYTNGEIQDAGEIKVDASAGEMKVVVF